YWGYRHGYFGEDDARAFYDELQAMLARQAAAPNSPQWFNTGLHWAYVITGPAQGHYFVDPKTGKMSRSQNAYEHPQPHACFIQSVTDDLVNEGGIMDLWVREARIFKYGSGTGSNFSRIRAEGEPLSGGGFSSGLMSFLRIGDRAASAIKSGGTTRRAAKMVTLDLDHPDIEEYINWKVVEEQKVAALVGGSKLCNRHLNAVIKACHNQNAAVSDEARFDIRRNPDLRAAVKAAKLALIPNNYIHRVIQLAQQGYTEIEFEEYDTNWDSKAYGTVSGQNSNNSVRVTQEFLEAVEGDRDWQLKRRVDGAVTKTLKARDLWEQISYAAWASADPGLQFDTTINDWHTCPEDGRINASNPCSEYNFLDDTACNLASLNLMKYLDAQGSFDIDSYRHASRLWTIVLEVSVLMAQFPSEAIARLSYEFRTLGLGYANLGTLLMTRGIPYDSKAAFAIGGALTAMLTGVAYATSAEMSGQLGPFPGFARNREHMLRVIRNHRRAAYNAAPDEYEGLSVPPVGIDPEHCPADLLQAARQDWDQALSLGEQHGYRNAQVTVLAPTGCLLGGSLVVTDRGLVRLNTLGDVEGETWQDVDFNVLTDDGPRAAAKFYVNGVAHTRRITTQNGYEIQGTELHRIRVVERETGDWVWKRFAEIKPGDRVPLSMGELIGEARLVTLPGLPQSTASTNDLPRTPETMTPDLAELVGFFMSAGEAADSGLRWHAIEPDVAERIGQLAESLFGINASISHTAGHTSVTLGSQAVSEWWQATGLGKRLPHSATGAAVPQIPDALLQTNDRVCYEAFVCGLHAAASDRSGEVMSWSTADRAFAL
ncbi:MAG TPA: adenosylcobalamin-dependent ribonucleoside-diphosphate reductase, partial [Limnochordia bacterium]|nr:adenosylcobalamin-dependent ribonucleoside-diphosphate reductase [Limnochordia bacterium]